MRIDLQNISLSFSAAPLFSDLSLQVETGDFVLIQGASGIGKTSLLRLFNRLQDPTSGSLTLDDRPIDDLDVTELRRRIGYVQQTPILIDGTVGANLRLPFTYRAANGATAPDDGTLLKRLADFQLSGVGLENDAAKLSVGQKQRVALIRSLLVEPDLLLCDEPTSALDEDSRTIVEDALERIAAEKRAAVVMITHTDYKPRQVDARRYRLKPEGLERLSET